MKSAHGYLCEKYREWPFETFGCLDGQEFSLRAVYGSDKQPLIALGESWDGLLYLGIPSAIIEGLEPVWSFKPCWQLPEQWGFELSDEQAIELASQAEIIATKSDQLSASRNRT